MLQWNDLHPYHAVHVMRFPGVPEIDNLRLTIAKRLEMNGLTSLRVDRQSGHFTYDRNPLPLDLRLGTTGPDPEKSLESEMNRQLNSRFDISRAFTPIRFFVLPEKGSFLLGATYFHPIADAESVVLLLRQIAADYLACGAPILLHSPDRHPLRHDNPRGMHFKVAVRKLLALPGEIRRIRHSYRAPLHNAGDLGNHYRRLHPDAETLDRLVKTTKAWGITLHDLLLAMLMRALSPLAPARIVEPRRRNISLGTIVNVRQEYGIDSHRTFGLFLGSFVITHPVPEGISLQTLATDLHLQTARIKRQKLYLASPVDLRIAGCFQALYSTSRQKTFYHKHHPLWGGITNLNMNRLWPEDATARPLDYFRAVSTGPATPLVLSATTFGKQLNFGLTYRSAVFTTREIESVQTNLQQQFRTPEDSP
ncbi:MAG: hypothetical protein MUC91_07110 [Verrucomicrobia bacterium]|nr:hypothetical protein [Verrucomicrobiota bacterium]